MSDYYIGELRIFPYNKIPANWLPCDGRQMTIQGNQALYSLLGVQYGGNAQTNFNLPDLRGRVPVATGTSASLGLQFISGNNGGAETVTLTAANLPQHSHYVAVSTSPGDAQFVGNSYISAIGDAQGMSAATYYGPATNLVAQTAATVGSTGASTPHANVQPFLALVICISTTGLYPVRQ